MGTRLQNNRTVAFEASSPDLRAGEILQDANGTTFPFRRAAQAFDVSSVLFISTVRKVESGNVHAQQQQISDSGLGTGSRA